MLAVRRLGRWAASVGAGATEVVVVKAVAPTAEVATAGAAAAEAVAAQGVAAWVGVATVAA